MYVYIYILICTYKTYIYILWTATRLASQFLFFTNVPSGGSVAVALQEVLSLSTIEESPASSSLLAMASMASMARICRSSQKANLELAGNSMECVGKSRMNEELGSE